MMRKAVVKVTRNEATDPDLFAYIKQFDNERMRAGALRALARAALNGGKAKRVESGVPVEPVMHMTEPAMPLLKKEVADMVESGPKPILPIDAALVAASRPLESRAAEPAVTGTRRFNTDAIADQFADFQSRPMSLTSRRIGEDRSSARNDGLHNGVETMNLLHVLTNADWTRARAFGSSLQSVLPCGNRRITFAALFVLWLRKDRDHA